MHIVKALSRGSSDAESRVFLCRVGFEVDSSIFFYAWLVLSLYVRFCGEYIVFDIKMV